MLRRDDVSTRREKIIFKHLALPVTDSPHVQGRSSSQGVASPPKCGLCRMRIRMRMCKWNLRKRLSNCHTCTHN